MSGARTKKSFPRHSWAFPAAFLLVVSFILIAGQSAASTLMKEVGGCGKKMKFTTGPEPKTELVPGFKVAYSRETASWSWQYAQKMENGCRKLTFTENPVTVSDDKVITIRLKTHVIDEKCEKPAVVSGVRGGIAGDAGSVFRVEVDGKPIAQ